MSDRFIDVHAHVFNVGYLPLQGIIESRVRPRFRRLIRPVASRVTSLLLDALERDESLPHELVEGLARAAGRLQPAAAMEAMLKPDVDLPIAFARSVSGEYLQAHERDIKEALEALGAAETAAGQPGARATDEALRSRTERAARGELLALEEADLRTGLVDLLERLARLLEDGAALIDWFLLMLARETRLVDALQSAWPESDLFVHHMMDMDAHYPPRGSLYPFVDLQLRRMRSLGERSRGRLLCFVAYGPFRENAVEIVEGALRAGCAGVKFYPPSGYRPVGNTADDLQGTGQSPAVIDRRNAALFRMCQDAGVPIFAHCSPGGMESSRGSGALSHPDGWERVLDQFPRLRLCLGHAGGDEGWTLGAGERDEDGFVPKVIALCRRFEHVYCEFGHAESLFDAARRANFFARLQREVGPGQGSFDLGHKIMYGSDWHLLARSPGHARFDDIFREEFDRAPVLRPYRRDFFRGTALAFLNLDAFIERNLGVLTVAEIEHLRGLAPLE